MFLLIIDAFSPAASVQGQDDERGGDAVTDSLWAEGDASQGLEAGLHSALARSAGAPSAVMSRFRAWSSIERFVPLVGTMTPIPAPV